MDALSSLKVAQPVSAYGWLADTKMPRIVCEAVTLGREIETSAITLDHVPQGCEVERLEKNGHPIILDPAPWSARLMSIIASRARKTLPPASLCALNWAKFGNEAGQPQLGDVLCYLLEDGAYVGLYLGEDQSAYHTLGADKTARISVTRVPKNMLYAVRRPTYQDDSRSVRAISLNLDGSLRSAT